MRKYILSFVLGLAVMGVIFFIVRLHSATSVDTAPVNATIQEGITEADCELLRVIEHKPQAAERAVMARDSAIRAALDVSGDDLAVRALFHAERMRKAIEAGGDESAAKVASADRGLYLNEAALQFLVAGIESWEATAGAWEASYAELSEQYTTYIKGSRARYERLQKQFDEERAQWEKAVKRERSKPGFGIFAGYGTGGATVGFGIVWRVF